MGREKSRMKPTFLGGWYLRAHRRSKLSSRHKFVPGHAVYPAGADTWATRCEHLKLRERESH